ncbi:Multi antimicrobial extrusion protein (Na(+)/drug antiporter), MATE family of MDR efflux pumps [Helicobacter bizzozeronii CCUG 35545]|nr:Multi antimicrobial extrusion protein (Na(+)/drug antiporter), MATE family of MDR efflux pumps [Helicobacter bizzozeronii CCUG 35545]
MISLSTYSMIDGMFVGNKLGKDALAAVGVCWPIFPTLIAYELLFGLGAASIASYFLGKNQARRARLVFSSVFYFVALSMGVIGWVLVPFSDEIARLLGSSELLLPMASIYIKVILMGAIFMVLHPLADVFVVNDKRPMLAMIAMLIGSLTNVLFNYLLLYVFEVGIHGSAIATVLGHAVGFLVLLSHFFVEKRATLLCAPFQFGKHHLIGQKWSAPKCLRAQCRHCHALIQPHDHEHHQRTRCFDLCNYHV